MKRAHDATTGQFVRGGEPCKVCSGNWNRRHFEFLIKEQYSPTGKLNYAHFESAPAKSKPGQPKANVRAPVPTPPVQSNLMVIAYYVTTPSGPCPVYLIDDPINGPRYWFCGTYL